MLANLTWLGSADPQRCLKKNKTKLTAKDTDKCTNLTQLCKKLPHPQRGKRDGQILKQTVQQTLNRESLE